MKNTSNKLLAIILALVFVSMLFDSCSNQHRTSVEETNIEKMTDEETNIKEETVDEIKNLKNKIDEALSIGDYTSLNKHIVELEKTTDSPGDFYATVGAVLPEELQWLIEDEKWNSAIGMVFNLPNHHNDDCGDEYRELQLKLYELLRSYAIELDNEERVQELNKHINRLK